MLSSTLAGEFSLAGLLAELGIRYFLKHVDWLNVLNSKPANVFSLVGVPDDFGILGGIVTG